MFKEQRKKGGEIRKWKKKKLQNLTCSHPPNSSCNPAMCVVTAECVGAGQSLRGQLGGGLSFTIVQLTWPLEPMLSSDSPKLNLGYPSQLVYVIMFSPSVTCLLGWLQDRISRVSGASGNSARRGRILHGTKASLLKRSFPRAHLQALEAAFGAGVLCWPVCFPAATLAPTLLPSRWRWSFKAASASNLTVLI